MAKKRVKKESNSRRHHLHHHLPPSMNAILIVFTVIVAVGGVKFLVENNSVMQDKFALSEGELVGEATRGPSIPLATAKCLSDLSSISLYKPLLIPIF
tara:strand:- start:4603 stop:4896 length:294 start_codon:yes stop_codon:yes gene_type:complete